MSVRACHSHFEPGQAPTRLASAGRYRWPGVCGTGWYNDPASGQPGGRGSYHMSTGGHGVSAMTTANFMNVSGMAKQELLRLSAGRRRPCSIARCRQPRRYRDQDPSGGQQPSGRPWPRCCGYPR